MSGLSKVARQRAKIKRLTAHLETWQEWARGLLEAPPDTSGPAMRQQIGAVWEATRDVLDAKPDRLRGVQPAAVDAAAPLAGVATDGNLVAYGGAEGGDE